MSSFSVLLFIWGMTLSVWPWHSSKPSGQTLSVQCFVYLPKVALQLQVFLTMTKALVGQDIIRSIILSGTVLRNLSNYILLCDYLAVPLPHWKKKLVLNWSHT